MFKKPLDDLAQAAPKNSPLDCFLYRCFDYRIKKRRLEAPFVVEMADRPAHFCVRRHAAPKNSPLDCFLYGCFDYRIKKKAPWSAFCGGDGGNRNRVLKPLIKAFYMLSLLFRIPPDNTTADSLIASVGSDTWREPSHSPVHVRRYTTPVPKPRHSTDGRRPQLRSQSYWSIVVS